MAIPSTRKTTDEQTVTAAIPDVVGRLRSVLGDPITALVASVPDTAAVDAWATGTRRPGPTAERRLRQALAVVELLSEVDEPEVIRAWFGGLNPELNDRIPALVISDEPDEVMLAARVFSVEG